MQKYTPNCIHHQQATHVCINRKCLKPNPFICSIQTGSPCKLIHSKCIISQLLPIFQTIQTNINKTHTAQFKQSCKLIQETIQLGIVSLEKQLQKFRIWQNNYGKHQKVIQFLNMIRSERYRQLSGKVVQEVIYAQVDVDNKLNIENVIYSKEQIMNEIVRLKESIGQMYCKMNKEEIKEIR